jgi:hypothetical protein
VGTKKPKMAENLKKVQRILMEKWDPIGVRGIPEARSEYDSYIIPLYSLLRKRASEREVIDYLNKIETECMGLSFSSENVIQEVARKLLILNVSDDEVHH